MTSMQLRAKRLLVEIEAIQTGDFDNRNGDLLALVNEALRDAALLAEQVAGANWSDERMPDDKE